MFRGRYETTIDVKGRTSVPQKFREALAAAGEARVVLTTNFDPCLHLYPLREWEAFERKLLDRRDPRERGVRQILRFYVGGAHDLEIDKMGRILVPPPLREHAGLSREVVWSGQVRIIELWSKEGYDKARAEASSGERREDIDRIFADLGAART